MANITKTLQSLLFTLQSLASNAVAISSVISIPTELSARVLIHFGRRATGALTAGVIFRTEVSASASGDNNWFPLAGQFQTLTAAVTSQAVNGTCNSGQKVVAMTNTAGMTVGDIVYIDNGTIGNSEWGRIAVVTTNTSITLEDNLTNAQTGSTVYPSGEMYAPEYDVSTVKRLRLVANGSNSGRAVAIEAFLTTADSIG